MQIDGPSAGIAKFALELLKQKMRVLLDEHPDCRPLGIGRVKDPKRAVQKALWHFGGDLTYLTDLARECIVGETAAAVLGLVKALIMDREIEIVSCEDTISGKHYTVVLPSRHC